MTQLEPVVLEDRLRKLDLSLLDRIDTQLDPDDRRSLLALHAAARSVHGRFAHLEIGSHLGGSLQTFVCDPACSAIVSLDPRPDRQPDERGIVYRYADNSTQRMLDNLAALPGASLEKLTTIEAGSDGVSADELPVVPQLCFVDGEHTDEAALRDARFCRQASAGSGCIAFHDSLVVHSALRAFLDELEREGVPFDAYVLPSCIFVVELGASSLRADPCLAARAVLGYRAYLHALAEWEPYRRDYRRPLNRVVRRAARLLRG